MRGFQVPGSHLMDSNNPSLKCLRSCILQKLNPQILLTGYLFCKYLAGFD